MARKSEHADVVVHSKSTESIYKIVGLFSKKILFVYLAFIRGFDGNRWNIQSVTSRPIVWLTSLSTTKWTPSWTFRSFIYYTFSAHIYIFAYFMFLFLNFIIFTQMFSMQFDVSSERSQSQNDMTKTKAKFVGCWLAGAEVKTQKNIQKKLCWNCPLESPAIYMQYSTEYDWCKHTNIAGVLETKSQKPDTHRENGTHDGNNFPFNFSTNLVRTCNLDAYHRYTCMRKWSAQRAWNIKVNNSKQTLKTWTRMLHSQSCWHSTLFSLSDSISFLLQSVCALMCISVVQMCFGMMCLYCSKVQNRVWLTYVGMFTSYLSFCFVSSKHCQKHCKITLANTKYRNDNQIHIQIRISNHISLVIWLSEWWSNVLHEQIDRQL